MNLFFYRGTGGEDVKDRDIVETVKVSCFICDHTHQFIMYAWLAGGCSSS